MPPRSRSGRPEMSAAASQSAPRPVVASVAVHPSAPGLATSLAQARLRAKPAARPARTRAPDWLVRGFAMLCGLILFVCVWAVVAGSGDRIPGPAAVWRSALEIFSDPFYQKGPNDQGIGWNVLLSLKRVAIGFGLAALVGIPLGFLLGRFRFLSDMAAPLIALLKPVSPLAWLPIGLLLFKAANPAAIYVIFVCSLWPMIVNTAVGVQQVPQDYLNIARVLNLSEWKVFTRILFPATLPYMITGVRLSIGVAWLVIVAAEMLTGGVGIGFWVWDEWNNLNVQHIIIAIITIGVVGLLLEQALVLLARRFSYGGS